MPNNKCFDEVALQGASTKHSTVDATGLIAGMMQCLEKWKALQKSDSLIIEAAYVSVSPGDDSEKAVLW